MVEHLTREQIAALLDEPDSVAGGPAHLDACEACAAEFENMSRMRMALSGLPDLAPPPGEWEAVRTRLPRRGPRSSPFQFAWNPQFAAAAVVLLFLAGLGVGRMIAPTGAASDANPAEMPATEGMNDYLRTVGRLRELSNEGPVGAALAENPALAAERLTRLDALIDATRESLRMAPADAALNDFLFEVVDERASVAGQLDRTLRQASMEY